MPDDPNQIAGAFVKITADLTDLQGQIDAGVAQVQAGAEEMSAAFSAAMARAASDEEVVAASTQEFMAAMLQLQKVVPVIADIDAEVNALAATGLSAATSAVILAEAYAQVAASASSAAPAIAGTAEAAQAAATSMGAAAQQMNLGFTQGLNDLGTQTNLFNTELQNLSIVQGQLGAEGAAAWEAQAQGAQQAVVFTGQAEQGLTGYMAKMAELMVTVAALKDLFITTAEQFGKFERAGEALTLITGDAKGAADALSQIRTLADQDAVAFDSMQNAGQRLAAIGVSLADIPGELDAIADAARVMNTSFDTVQQRFDQITESGTLMARSLTSMGITIADVGKAFDHEGESVAAIKKAFMDYGETADRALVLATALMQKHGDAAKQTADDVTGAWQRISNAFTKANTEIGEQVDGWKGLATVAGGALKVIEDALLLVIGSIKIMLDVVISIAAPIVDVFIGIGKAIKDAISGNTAQAALDIKDGLAKAYGVMHDFTDNVKKDWNDTWTAIAKTWDDGTGTVTTKLGAVKDAATQANDAITKTFESQKQALADAQANLERVRVQVAANAAGQGQLEAAVDAVTKAYDALNGKVASTIDTIKISNDAFGQSTQKVLDTIRDYNAGVTALGPTLSAIDSYLEQAALKWDKLTASQQEAVMSIGVVEKSMADLAASNAFDKVMTQVTDLGIKYPAAIRAIDAATLDFLNSLNSLGLSAKTIADLSAPVIKAMQEVVASQNALDASQVQLTKDQEAGEKAVQQFGITMGTVFDGAKENASQLAQKIKLLGTTANDSGQQIIDLATRLQNMGIVTAGVYQAHIQYLERTLVLMEAQHAPLMQILEVQSTLLNQQLSLAQAIGASGVSTLAWAEALNKVHVEHQILMDQTMGLTNLYEGMVKSFGKAWDDTAKGIADAVVSGQNFGQVMSSVFDNLKKSLAELVSKYFMTQLKDAILENTSLMQKFNEFFNFTFAQGGTVTKGFETLTASAGEAGKSIGQAAAAATDGVTKTTSAASQGITQITGQAMSSIFSLVSLVSGIISAITGIIGNIEMAHMEKTLGQIETNTREIFNAVGGGSGSVAGTSLVTSQKVTGILETLQGVIVTLLVQINADLDSIDSKIGTIGTGPGGGDASGLLKTIDDLRAQIQILNEQFTQAQNASLAGPALGTTNTSGSTATGSAAVNYGTINSGTVPAPPAYVPTVADALLANIDSNVADILDALAFEFKETTQLIHARAMADAMSGFLNIPLDLLAKVNAGLPALMNTLNGTAQGLTDATATLANSTQQVATAAGTLATAATTTGIVLGSAATQAVVAAQAILGIHAPGTSLFSVPTAPSIADVAGFKTMGGSPLGGNQIYLNVTVPGTIVGTGGVQALTDTVAATMINTLSGRGIRLTRG